MRDPEYDRFGPWVIEISEEDPPPPLFLPYLAWEEEPLISVKIPRHIERRNAHPGMNLYDYVVTLFEEDLVILQRIGEEDVAQETFRYRDIQFLHLSEHLLKGTLHLSTAVSSYDLLFNTTSKEIMRTIVDLIRERYDVSAAPPRGGEGRGARGEQADTATGELSYYFTRLLKQELAADPDQFLLAAQGDTPIGLAEKALWRRILFGAISKTLMESLHFCDGRELKIITRGKLIKYSWQTEYGADTYTIPLGNVRGVSWVGDEKNSAVLYLNLETAGETVQLGMIRDNAWIFVYDQFLTAVTDENLAAKT